MVSRIIVTLIVVLTFRPAIASEHCGIATRHLARLQMHEVMKTPPEPITISKILAEIKNEEDALEVYAVLNAQWSPIPMNVRAQWIQILKAKSNEFSDATTNFHSPGTLVTLSLEKETLNNRSLSLMYRPSQVSETDWFKLSDDERTNRFMIALENSSRREDVASFERLEHTSFGQSWLSKPKEEIAENVTEVVSDSFHVSTQSMFDDARWLSDALNNEQRGFHFHIVGEVPIKSRTDPFIIWADHLNNYVYFKGLEEGMHPMTFTKTREPLAIQSPWASVGNKFNNVGIRSGIYGASSDPSQFAKIGVELRDPSKTLEGSKTLVTRVKNSVGEVKWESKNAPMVYNPMNTKTLYLSSTELDEILIKEGIVNVDIKWLSSVWSSGLSKFENLEVFNYQLGKMQKPSPAQIARIKSARSKFIADIKDVQRSLVDFEAKKVSVSSEELTTALRECVNDWARAARISEIFDNF